MAELISCLSTLLMLTLLIIIMVLLAKRLPKKLTRQQQKSWLAAHMLSIIIFLGGLLGTLLLTMAAASTVTAPEHIQAAHLFARSFDWFLIIPGAFLTLITGVWLALRTPWGLTKYRWIVVKTLGTAAAITFGSTWMRIWFEQTIYYSLNTDIINPAYIHNRQMLLLGTALSLTMLIFLVIISYFKPWGKRNSFLLPSSLE